MKDNNMQDVIEVYKSLLKYFDTKGYIVIVPEGKIASVEISNSPTNNVEISLKSEFNDARKMETGKYNVHGKFTFSVAATEETDQQFIEKIFGDMQYFMEHFTMEVNRREE